MNKIAVIGAGITGITSAYALAKRGFEVTVYEKNRYPAIETSYANGGQLSASNAEVWNNWNTIIHGLKWVTKSDAPLLINMKPNFHKLNWFLEFVSNISNYAINTENTARMAISARKILFDWANEEKISFDLEKRGILHIYRNKDSFDHASKVSQLLARGGLDRRAVTPEEMKSIEPTLQGNFYGGFFTDSDASGDIHKYTVGLAQACQRLGVEIEFNQSVRAVENINSSVIINSVKDGMLEKVPFDGIVICAGIESRRLAASLGDRVNIYPVKGYSITLPLLDENSQLKAPMVSLLDDETKIVASRFGNDRFRVAGTAEFNGNNKDIRHDRIKPLIEWVHTGFPDVNTSHAIPWAGLRPMMPNMMPSVFKGRMPNVFYNTGHGHLGWTLSAFTAELLASIVQKKTS